jgi:hypothetical protein
VTGVPLVYVIRVVLIPEEEKDDPPFGDEDTKYTSIDPMLLSSLAMLISTTKTPRTLRPMDRLYPPS